MDDLRDGGAGEPHAGARKSPRHRRPSATSVGERVELTATAIDPRTAPCPSSGSVVLVHCSGGYCHDHPGPTDPADPSYNVPFDDHGDDTRMEIIASATDQFGVARRADLRRPAPAADADRQLARWPSAGHRQRHAAGPRPQVTAGARVSVSSSRGRRRRRRARSTGWSGRAAARSASSSCRTRDLTLTAVYLTPIDRALRRRRRPCARRAGRARRPPRRGDSFLRARDYARRPGLLVTGARGARDARHDPRALRRRPAAAAARGAPTTDEVVLANGRYNELYGPPERRQPAPTRHLLAPQTDAHHVQASIYRLWKSMGGEKSKHGYPVSDEAANRRAGRFSRFANGSIYWRSAVRGPQRARLHLPEVEGEGASRAPSGSR